LAGGDESGAVVEKKDLMLVFDAAHPRLAHVLKGDAAISAALPKKIGKNGDIWTLFNDMI
jgi:hypothetical protein